jgi:hypothetical protein
MLLNEIVLWEDLNDAISIVPEWLESNRATQNSQCLIEGITEVA